MVEIKTMDVDIYNWMILDDSNSVYDIMYIWYVYIYMYNVEDFGNAMV